MRDTVSKCYDFKNFNIADDLSIKFDPALVILEYVIIQNYRIKKLINYDITDEFKCFDNLKVMTKTALLVEEMCRKMYSNRG